MVMLGTHKEQMPTMSPAMWLSQNLALIYHATNAEGASNLLRRILSKDTRTGEQNLKTIDAIMDITPPVTKSQEYYVKFSKNPLERLQKFASDYLMRYLGMAEGIEDMSCLKEDIERLEDNLGKIEGSTNADEAAGIIRTLFENTENGNKFIRIVDILMEAIPPTKYDIVAMGFLKNEDKLDRIKNFARQFHTFHSGMRHFIPDPKLCCLVLKNVPRSPSLASEESESIMTIYTVSENVEVVLDGQKMLLEMGDQIVFDEDIHTMKPIVFGHYGSHKGKLLLLWLSAIVARPDSPSHYVEYHGEFEQFAIDKPTELQVTMEIRTKAIHGGKLNDAVAFNIFKNNIPT